MTISYGGAVKNARLDAIETTIGTAAVLRLYSGSVPANADASLGAAVLLATGALPSDYFNAASGGTKTKLGTWTVTGQSGAGSGTAATFFRLWDSGVTAAGIQGTVTATGGGGDMTIDNNSIADTQVITDTAFTITSGN